MKIGYARVSTPSEKNLEYLKSQCKLLEADGCDFVFRDIASEFSDRREFNMLLDLVAANKVKEIAFENASRISRDLNKFSQFVRDLVDSGIKVIELNPDLSFVAYARASNPHEGDNQSIESQRRLFNVASQSLQ